MSDTELDFLQEPEPKPRQGLGFGAIVLLAGVIVVVIVVGAALLLNETDRPTAAAPDFSFTTFDGESMKLSDLRGRVVILNFWASWCGPCRDEAPALQAIWDNYQDDEVVVLGIAYADSTPMTFIEEFGLTYPTAPDEGTRISDLYNIQGVPETFIIDQDGNVAEFIFAQVDEAGLTASINRLLQTS